jgi:hypothetical protein
MVSRELRRDESIILANLFFNNTRSKTISPLEQGGYLVSGGQPGFIAVGPVAYPDFSVKADFCYLGSDQLLLEGGTELVVKGRIVFSSEMPVTMLWNLKERTVLFSTPHTAFVRLVGVDGLSGEKINNAGEQSTVPAIPPPDLVRVSPSGVGELGGVKVINTGEQSTLPAISPIGMARVFLSGVDGLGGEIIINAGEQSTLPAIPSAEMIKHLRNALVAMEHEIIRNNSAIKSLTASSNDWQPVWELPLKGKITALAKVADAVSGGVWAVSQDAQTSTITFIDRKGRLKQIVQQPGEILSILPAVGENQSQSFAMLVGFKDDMLRAYSESGDEIWAAKASIHPSFLIGDHYDAPWFTNPGPPNNMSGVYSLLIGDFWNTGSEEIAVGRPSTVEFRSLKGQLLSSVPTRWGNNTSLAFLESGTTNGSGPMLLVGKAYTGNPTLSGINGQYKNVSDGLYDKILTGFTNMHSWLMRGLAGLRVADINGDGSEEVIYTLSGHWNELRVYNAAGTPLWMHFFGPDKNTGAPFMTALEVGDLDGEEQKEVVVATRMGWVVAFDHTGRQIWQRQFESGITSLVISEKQRKLVVGCDDGSLTLLDGSGKQLAAGRMDGAVKSMVFDEDGIIASSANGMVRCYAIPH